MSLIQIIIALYLLCLCETRSQDITYNVLLTDKVMHVTEKEFLSFTLDFSLKADPERPWFTLNFTSPRVRTLIKGLSPAILRFGGGSADAGIFYNVSDINEQRRILELNKVAVESDSPFGGIVAIFPQDIDNLFQLARLANGRLLYDLNIELRFGAQWDTTNARLLLDYMIQKGYSPYVDFELGNEPPYKKFEKPSFTANGKRLAEDFKILRQILNFYPQFNSSRLVGPDIETPRDGTYSGDGPKLLRHFLSNAHDELDAVTVHHYYFNGPSASVEQFYNVTYFRYLESTLPLLIETVANASGSFVDVWLDETADSNQGGTPNVTDSFASGFLWLDKLGLAAKYGIKMVARQTLYGYSSTQNYPLLTPDLYPNPDYWVSYVYKKLVGNIVLNVDVTQVSSQNFFGGRSLRLDDYNGLFRAYAHCVSAQSIYNPSSVAFFGININTNKAAKIYLNMTSSDNNISNLDQYLLTPTEKQITSRTIQLNGYTLRMTDDNTLPKLIPKPVRADSIIFPPLSFGFVVLNGTFSSCTNTGY